MFSHNISAISPINKLTKNAQILSIMSLMSGITIILNTVLECESESLDKGRSYTQMNIHISDCFFSRSSKYSESSDIC